MAIGRKSIPKKVEVSKGYAEVLARISQFNTRKAEARGELAAIRQKLISGNGDDGINEKAEALISGRPVGADETDAGKARELSAEIATIERALEILSQTVGRESSIASSAVCDLVEDDYQTIVKGICGKLLELHELHMQFDSLVDSLNADGVNWTGRDKMWPMHPLFLENAKGKYSPIALYLRNAAKHGFISEKSVPDHLKE